MAAWARSRDPSRPIHYEHDWSCRDVDMYSRMYATHEEVDAIGRGEEEPWEDASLDERRRGLREVQPGRDADERQDDNPFHGPN